MSDLIASLEAEARDLVLEAFDEAVALALGAAIVRRAEAARAPVIVNIRSASRTFFHAALPGSAPLNDLWARRKSNTVLMFQESSLLVGQRHLARGTSLAVHGLDTADYADHGGGVPIMVRGTGLVAVATVSGLPSAEDHALVVAALRDLIAAPRP